MSLLAASPRILIWANMALSMLSSLAKDSFTGFGTSLPNQSKVRIHIGSTIDGNDWSGGTMPEVRLYDKHGEPLGKATIPYDDIEYDPLHVHHLAQKTKPGQYQDYYVNPPTDPSEAPEYLSLRVTSEEDDSICISAIGLTMPGGRKTVILGDLMHNMCKWSGYVSATSFEMEGQRHTPYCFWMGGDRKWGYPDNVWFHLRSFDGTDETLDAYKNNDEMLCNSYPRLHRLDSADGVYGPWDYTNRVMYEPPLTFPANATDTTKTTLQDPAVILDKSNWTWKRKQLVCDPDKPQAVCTKVFDDVRDVSEAKIFEKTWEFTVNDYNDWDAKKRRDLQSVEPAVGEEEAVKQSHQPRWAYFAHSTSDDPERSATYFCGDLSKDGPDYANSYERMYCKMSTRELLPYCRDTYDVIDPRHCFDFDSGDERPAADFVNVNLSLQAGVEPQRRERLDIGSLPVDEESEQ